jgi:hypothetical protein
VEAKALAFARRIPDVFIGDFPPPVMNQIGAAEPLHCAATVTVRVAPHARQLFFVM